MMEQSNDDWLLRLAHADYAIYGYGKIGKEAERELHGLSLRYICDRSFEGNNCLRGGDITPVELFQISEEKRPVVLICASEVNRTVIRRVLGKFGWIYGWNMFYYHEFMRDVYSWLRMILQQKIYLPILTFSVTGYCSLRCRKCSLKMPYQDHPKHRDLSEACDDLAKAFFKVDFSKEISIVGGEPLLWPYLVEFLDVLYSRYHMQYQSARVLTNGTVPLSSELIACLKRNGVMLEVTHYPNAVNEEQYASIIEICRREDILYRVIDHPYWFDFGLTPEDAQDGNGKAIYLGCDSLCRGVYDGKLVYCFPGYFSGLAYGFSDAKQGLDLDRATKQEIFRYYYGCDTQRVPAYCRYCRGFSTAPRIPVAEQMES